jgi:putative ABC transport system ATP-binding protein
MTESAGTRKEAESSGLSGHVSGPLVIASGLHKSYSTKAETVHALRGVDVAFERGEFVAITGPSGSGKSTLLHCLSGLDDLDEGTVTIEGRDIAAMSDAERTAHRASTMGFVFQAYHLIPVFTALENVALPLLLGGRRFGDVRRDAADALGRMGLADRAKHRPGELSGGEQQRVALARAIVGGPTILWADEPTGNLDTANADSVVAQLEDLARDGVTVILVTHDTRIAARAPRHVEVLDGRLVADRSRQAEASS